MNNLKKKNQSINYQSSELQSNPENQDKNSDWIIQLETIKNQEATQLNGGISIGGGGFPNTVSTNLPTDYTKANNSTKKNSLTINNSDWLLELETIKDTKSTNICGGRRRGKYSSNGQNVVSTNLPIDYSKIK